MDIFATKKRKKVSIGGDSDSDGSNIDLKRKSSNTVRVEKKTEDQHNQGSLNKRNSRKKEDTGKKTPQEKNKVSYYLKTICAVALVFTLDLQLCESCIHS